MIGYRLVRSLSRVLLWLFYRRIEVVGLERFPVSGPVIVAANHQNALVDGMLLLATMPRPVVSLAKAPLFHNPLIGPFLKALGAIPVHRRQDAPEGARRDRAANDDMFGSAIAALRANGAILIFPEGVSQPEPHLMPLKTGAARILLGAEAGPDGPIGARLLPVGLVYHEPGEFRTGWAVVTVGEPVPTAEAVALHAQAPAEAARRLTEALTDALGRVTLEAGDRETLRLVQVAESVWRAESASQRSAPSARAEWRRRVARAYRYLSAREPDRVAAIRQEVERYAKALELARLDGRSPAGRPSLGVATRYAAREGLALLVGAPLALWGLLNHALPYNATAAAIRLARPEADVEATFKIAGGLVIYLLCWAGEGWLAWTLGGGWALALFVVSLAPTGFFALAWAERLRRVARETGAFLRFLVDRDLMRLVVDRRRAIMADLSDLVRLVPQAVLDGDAAAPPGARARMPEAE